MIHRFRRAALASSVAVLSATALVACSDGDDDGADAPIEVPTTDAGTPPDDTGAPPPGTDVPPDDTIAPPSDTDAPAPGTDTPPVTGTPPDDGGDPPPATDVPPTAIALTADDLEGNWSTGCLLDDPDDPDSEYESASISFDEGEFEFASDSFSDAGCTESLGEDAELDGTFTLGDVVVTSEGLATTAIDLVTSGEDGGEAVTVLDLVLLEGGTLYFANGDFGELEDVVGQPRPDALELDEPYTRQPDAEETSPPEEMPPGAVALTEDDVEGSWSTGCLLDDPDEADSEYESASITFDDEAFEFESDSFSDAGCTQSLGEDVELEGTFTLGAAVTTADGLVATEIDLLAREEDEDESVTVLDLIYIDGDTLYFADGDFDELDELAGQPRPSDLELDEPFRRR